jgi:alkylated DNA repair dioxygenase AlkB
MAATQISLFARHHILPKGFDHKDEVLSPDREFVLVEQFAQLPFKEFEFQGFLGRRRVVSFGWRYDFSRRELQKAEEIPDFLLHLRVTATEFAGLDASRFQQVLVTEYSPGAGIGWDKDRPEFEHVIGVSLVSPCLFRLRRKRERIGTH